MARKPPARLTTRELIEELHRLVAQRQRIIDEIKQLTQQRLT